MPSHPYSGASPPTKPRSPLQNLRLPGPPPDKTWHTQWLRPIPLKQCPHHNQYPEFLPEIPKNRGPVVMPPNVSLSYYSTKSISSCENISMNYLRYYLILSKVLCSIVSLGNFHIIRMSYLPFILLSRDNLHAFFFSCLLSSWFYWMLIPPVTLLSLGGFISYWCFCTVFITLFFPLLFSVLSLHIIDFYCFHIFLLELMLHRYDLSCLIILVHFVIVIFFSGVTV